ncbi:hypothetical protein GDO86_006713 [Hymenochirus boettgeri]|uniref:Olfactory receptor n=1 Tax=Hymenochirus boettgeri TaxID=247094 RepID=A0A8T2J9P6_9PIPI|nr:hypothetical protein GDO86_006713 [Hymenochirus boettgeri]
MTNQTTNSYFYICWLSDCLSKHPILSLVFLLIYLIGLSGNIILILVTFFDSHLQTPMYFFLRNLSFVDICYISATIPKLMDIFLTGNNAIPFKLCFTQMGIFIAIATTEVFLLTFMAYDRYVAICKPLSYLHVMNERMNILLVLASWMFGVVNSVFLTTFVSQLYFCYSQKIQHLFCDIKALLNISCNYSKYFQIMLYLEVLFVGFCPFLLNLASYVKIIISVLKSTLGRWKTFSTCTSHLTVLLLFYGTSICMYIKPLSDHFEKRDQLFTVLYVAVTPMLNPIIYSLRNKEVKKILRKLLP